MSPDQKARHLAFLRTPFVPATEFPIYVFTADDLLLLLQFGSWYQALETGQIEAVTDKQKLFLERIAQGHRVTGHECLWLKYKKILRDAGKALQRSEPAEGLRAGGVDAGSEYVDPLASG